MFNKSLLLHQALVLVIEHAYSLVTDHVETPEEISSIEVIYQGSSNADRRAGIQHKSLVNILQTTCLCR
jgi:hypothetical protein